MSQLVPAPACNADSGPRDAADGQAETKVVPSPDLGVEVERAAVPLDDDRARDRQALTGAAPDLLRGEERLEDPSRIVAGMPQPVSLIAITTSSPSRRVPTRIVPRLAVADHVARSRAPR